MYDNYLYRFELEEIPDPMDIDQDVTSSTSKYELKVDTSQKIVYIPIYNCSSLVDISQSNSVSKIRAIQNKWN